MIIEISEYRKIRFKNTYADQLITGMQRELSQAYSINAKKDSANLLAQKIINRMAATIDSKDATIADLNKQFNEMTTIAREPLKWYRRRWVPIAAAALGGIVLTKSLSK